MNIRRLSTVILTIVFLGAMFGALFHVSEGMGITGNPHGCPFMLEQQEALCSMSIAEHLNAWQSSFAAVVAPLVQLLIVTLLLVTGVGLTMFVSGHRRFVLAVVVVLHELRKKLYTFYVRPLQELFARGILHPQVYS